MMRIKHLIHANCSLTIGSDQAQCFVWYSRMGVIVNRVCKESKTRNKIQTKNSAEKQLSQLSDFFSNCRSAFLSIKESAMWPYSSDNHYMSICTQCHGCSISRRGPSLVAEGSRWYSPSRRLCPLPRTSPPHPSSQKENMAKISHSGIFFLFLPPPYPPKK